jgi:hypothetical protein
MYFLLGGFLDGRSGFSWCVLQAFYEYLILLKVWEVENSPQLYDLGLETSKKVESQNVISNLGTSDS